MTRQTLIALAITLALLVPIHAMAQSPIGKWRTFDDTDGKESGQVIIEDTAGILSGRITAIADPQKASLNCNLCTDTRKGQPILGMTILTGMRQDDDKWNGGQILDPKTGSVYHCSMKLSDGGAKLVLRGYIGVPLFGRSQTWLRATP
jgi:uncharacterized protein (DUF2147 family)